ncbi:Transcription factor iws [Salix suchowensis]|nr:Transcription factor iws [Salix suchowensis]
MVNVRISSMPLSFQRTHARRFVAIGARSLRFWFRPFGLRGRGPAAPKGPSSPGRRAVLFRASSEDDYVQERPGGAKPVKKAVKKKSRRSHNGEEEDEVGRPRRQAQKKRKRQQQPEIDLSTLPPEEGELRSYSFHGNYSATGLAKKIRLDMQIDAIIKPKKGSRSKKRKNEDELDRFADDEVARLREAMINAADQDDIAIKEGNPALQKLRLLPEVMDVLRKCVLSLSLFCEWTLIACRASLAQSIVDNNLLQGVRRWLEPLPDRSIPALNIQREFFPLLKKMDYIDSAVLRESGLGKVMIFYTRCKRVQPDIARTAGDLVSTWSRPIIKRSASYRDRIIPIAQEENAPSRPTGRSLNAILSQAKESEKGRVRKNAVNIPRSDLGSYTVAPKSGGLMRGNAVSVEGDVERRRKAAERLRVLTRKTVSLSLATYTRPINGDVLGCRRKYYVLVAVPEYMFIYQSPGVVPGPLCLPWMGALRGSVLAQVCAISGRTLMNASSGLDSSLKSQRLPGRTRKNASGLSETYRCP